MYIERDGNVELWSFQCLRPGCGHHWNETDLTGIWIRCPKCDQPDTLKVTRWVKRKPSLWMRTFTLFAVLCACAAVSIATCTFVKAVLGA